MVRADSLIGVPAQTRQTFPATDSAASELGPVLDGSTTEELIPGLMRNGLQQLIELEVVAKLGTDRQERGQERLSYRPRLPRTQTGDIG